MKGLRRPLFHNVRQTETTAGGVTDLIRGLGTGLKSPFENLRRLTDSEG